MKKTNHYIIFLLHLFVLSLAGCINVPKSTESSCYIVTSEDYKDTTIKVDVYDADHGYISRPVRKPHSNPSSKLCIPQTREILL